MDRRHFLKLLAGVGIAAALPPIETPAQQKPCVDVSPGTYIKDGSVYFFGGGTFVFDNIYIDKATLICHEDTVLVLKNSVTISGCEISLGKAALTLQGHNNTIINTVFNDGNFRISPNLKTPRRSASLPYYRQYEQQEKYYG
jgi:hypothetical protein